jgi:hypothetical protein
MEVQLLLDVCNRQVLPISEGNRGDSRQFKPCKGNYLTTRHTRARRAPRVATIHNAVKETIKAHLTQVHVFHAYAMADAPWVAHALSRCTPVRYGRIASVSVTHETTQFAGPHKILYAPVHNSNFLTEAKWSVLNRHWWGLPSWSSEFQIRSLPFLPIKYSPFSPNCPARSHIKPFYQLFKFSTFQILNQGIKSHKSHEWNLSQDFFHNSIH